MAFARRRVLPSVAHNFLATLTSRYSDYDGYWVFGLFVSDLRCSTVDLLAADDPATSGSQPWRAFATLARHRFAEQVRANSVTGFVRRAELTVERGRSLSGTVSGPVLRNGFEVSLSVEVTSDLGKDYRQRVSVFVAPHDPSIEHRSVRRGMESITRRVPNAPR